MSDSSRSGTSDDTQHQITYSDFYELLGVDKTADEEVIESRARKLLARFHPDRSDHPNAAEIYKTVNRAQDVLTDSQQRKVYNKLGHSDYIDRREQGGEVEVQETVSSSGFEAGSNTTQGVDGGGDIGSTERNQRNTWAGSVTESEGYKIVTDFDFNATGKETVWKFYRELWTGRFILVALFGVAAYYFSRVSPGVFQSYWGVIGGPQQYGINGALVIAVSLLTTIVTFVTGIISYRVLKQVEDDIELEESAEDQIHEKRKEDVSRGLNADDSAGASEWDVPTKYDSLEAQRDQPESERVNRAYIRGKQLLSLTVVMLVFGAFAPGVTPVEYIYELFAGHGTDAAMWWEFGTAEGEAIPVLVNAVYSLVLAFITVFAVGLTVYGVTKEVWYQSYFTRKKYWPFTWDTVIGSVAAVIAVGAIIGRGEIYGVPVDDVPDSVLTVIGVNGELTGVNVLLAGLFLMFGVVYLFQIRAWLNRRRR